MKTQTEENWDLYIFSFVRNPWDLLYSHFKFYKRRTGYIEKELEDNPELIEKMPQIIETIFGIDFRDWVKQYLDDFNFSLTII